VAASRLSVMLAKRGREARMRIASKLDFADLRDSSSVLIGGAYTNRWTMELSQKLRYKFAFTCDKPSISRFHDRRFVEQKAMDPDRQVGYRALHRRLHPHRPSASCRDGQIRRHRRGPDAVWNRRGGPDPDALVPLLQKLPPTWRTQNLEVVLHSQVLGDAPAAPELIAYHLW